MQVYKKTYSWAHNTNDANWAAYITIARAPEHRHSEEDMERGVGNASVSGRPVMLSTCALPTIESRRALNATHLKLPDVMPWISPSSPDRLSNPGPRHEKGWTVCSFCCHMRCAMSVQCRSRSLCWGSQCSQQ